MTTFITANMNDLFVHVIHILELDIILDDVCKELSKVMTELL